MKALPTLSALTIGVAAALPAVASIGDEAHFVTLTIESLDDSFSQVFDSEVVSAGFSFELKGSSYGYFLTLQVDNEFYDQTGLIGYQIGRKIDGNATWYKLQRTDYDPQTYRSGPLSLNQGLYWMQLAPLHYGSGGAQPLSLVPTSVPSVPEPETAAMLMLGLGVVGWMARRRSL